MPQIIWFFFSTVTPSSHSLNLFNKYLLSTYHAKHFPSSWGFSSKQKTKSATSLSFHLSGGRQIILNKYIICVTNNTVWRKTNALQKERECYFASNGQRRSLWGGGNWSRDIQTSRSKSVLGGRSRMWLSPEAGAHGCVKERQECRWGLGDSDWVEEWWEKGLTDSQVLWRLTSWKGVLIWSWV